MSLRVSTSSFTRVSSWFIRACASSLRNRYATGSSAACRPSCPLPGFHAAHTSANASTSAPSYTPAASSFVPRSWIRFGSVTVSSFAPA